MLAQTFKTAAELGIPEQERNALVTVLYMAEDGEIKPEQIYMASYHLCDTTHCLAGWANTVDRTAFPEIGPSSSNYALRRRLPPALVNLFGLTDVAGSTSLRYAGPERAIRALRTYLETGECPCA